MKNRMIKAGTAAVPMKVGNVAFNTEAIIEMMNTAKDCGILVFPDMCISGYTCGDLFNQEALLSGGEEGLRKIAEASF